MGNEWEKMKKWQIEDIRRHLLLRFIIKEKSLIWCAKELPVPLSLLNTIDIFLWMFGLLRFMLIHNLRLELKLILTL